MRSGLPTFLLCGLGALALAGCGSGGGSDETSFEATDVAFTFEHPAEFKQDDADDGKVLARLELDPNQPNDAIKVRQTSARELPLSAFLDTFQRQFSAQVGPVRKRTEKHADREMGVLQFGQSITEQGKRVRATSTSYFFSGGGKTWQLECVSTGAEKPKVDAACKQAVDSVAFED